MKIRVDSIKKYTLALMMMFFIVRPQFIITMYPENGLKMLSYLELGLFIVIFLLSPTLFLTSIIRDKQFIIVLVLHIYIYVVTRINMGTLGLAFYNGIAVVCAVGFIKYFSLKHGFKEFIKYFNYAVSSLVWVNLITMFIFPDGIVRSTVHIYNSAPVFFLGQVNQFSIHLILSIILFIALRLMDSSYKIGNIVFCVLPIILTIFKDVATTAIVAIGIMIIGIIVVVAFPNLISRFERPVLNTMIVVIVFFLLSRILTLPIIVKFITSVLGKDITLASRTAIWEEAFNILKDRNTLLFGRGEISGSAYVVLNTGAAFSAHNILLQVCFISGLIGLVLFILFFYRSIYRIEKSNQVFKRAVISVCLLAFCVINMTEVYTFPMVYSTILVFDCFGRYLASETDIAIN